MIDCILVWKRMRTPVFFDEKNIPLTRALPDVLHNHCIPRSAHLSASVEALKAVEANHHHNLLKDKVMT